MSDEAQNKTAKRAANKPARATNPRSRQPDKVKAAAATAGIGKAARVSVPVVPESPAASGLSRRASAVRLGLLTTTLALIVGGFAWFSEAPVPFASQPTQISSASSPASAPRDPLAPHVRDSLEQELRLAALALDIQQSHDSLARLWDDARSLSESVGALASGIENLKTEVGTSRIDTAAAVARLEERLHDVKLATLAEPTQLGDPSLRELIQLGYPEIAAATRMAETEAAQPATTGGLPEASPAEASPAEAGPRASVKVAFNKRKPFARSTKTISGWQLHSVRDDLALVVSEGAQYEVKAGELLPGVGIVRSIKKRGEQWVVLTAKGVISEIR